MSLRCPALVWEEGPGLAFACLLLEEGPLAAAGRSPSEALKRARERLKRRVRKRHQREATELLDPALHLIKVAVRPEHRQGEPGERGARVFPGEEVVMRVPCVTAERAAGLRVAFLPTLERTFLLSEEQPLAELVAHYAREALRGCSPRELARRLAPHAPRLEAVSLNLPRRFARQEDQGLALLRQVADPLGGTGAARLPRPFGREAELSALVEKLRGRQSLLLVGEPGAGKTTLLAAAARLLARAQEDEPGEARAADGSRCPRLWLTGAQRLIAGMAYLGQWEERLEAVIAQLGAIDGLLCLEDLREALLTGGRGPHDSVASFLLPYLHAGELRLVAEVTPAGLDACRRHLPGLVDALEPVPVPPLGRAATLEVLRRVSEGAARDLRVPVAQGTIEAVERLFRRFSPYRAPPGPQVALLQDVLEEAERAGRGRGAPAGIDQETVVRAFVRRSGLPERLLRDEQPLAREEVEAALGREVIGQEAAVRLCADAVIAFKAGLNDPHRPLAALLFTGPTGVGKTALARALARYLFGHGAAQAGAAPRERLVRLDMSEYAGFDAATRLLGAPDGPPSELVRQVRRQPFTVLLLDEIEKAAPEVLDVLLGLLDEGRLSDPWGRVTWFTSAVVILTSNLGAEADRSLGFGEAPAGGAVDAVRAHFRPELFNRLDAVVPFQALPPAVVRQVAGKELTELAAREGLQRLGLRLTWSEAVVELLAREGFDRRFGARPLQRCLEERVVAPVARWLAQHPAPRPGALHLTRDDADRVQVTHTAHRGP